MTIPKNGTIVTESAPRPSTQPERPAAEPTQQVHDIECAWVPGTTDRVRFTLLRHGSTKRSLVRELAVARLAVMFGRSLMDDLYLRGRARLKLSEVQLLELA